MGDRPIRRLKAHRITIAEALGVSIWSRPGLDGLDVRLAEELGWSQRGYFVELGANDGLQQSNTYLLEHELSWTGALVEAVPQLAAEAARNRPHCEVVCAAVSDAARCGQVLSMSYSDLTTHVGSGHRLTAATTLPMIWMQLVPQDASPTLLSLDVEGHELQVLDGLASVSHRPDWMLIETSSVDAVSELLHSAYTMAAKLSRHDYLYRRL